MLYYFARVELRGYPSGQDYDNLHEAMRKKSFIRTIRSGDNVTYHLPDAEYVWETTQERTSESLRVELSDAVKAVYTSFSLVVMRATEAAWQGLHTVK